MRRLPSGFLAITTGEVRGLNDLLIVPHARSWFKRCLSLKVEFGDVWFWMEFHFVRSILCLTWGKNPMSLSPLENISYQLSYMFMSLHGQKSTEWFEGVITPNQIPLTTIVTYFSKTLQKPNFKQLGHYTCMQCGTSHLQTVQENTLSHIILETYRKFTVATVRFTQNVSCNIYIHPIYQQVANVTV